MPTMTRKQTASVAVGTAEGAVGLPPFLGATEVELLLFGGKGGVGKTTCAAATALHLAAQRPDELFLVVSIDPAHSLLDSFAACLLPDNLKVLEVDARQRLQEFKSAHSRNLREIALRGTFLDDDDVARLLDLSMPGLDEVIAFQEVSALVDRREFSCVIVDTAPTGHTLRFLELPVVLGKWIEALDAMLAKHRYMTKLYCGTWRKDEIDIFLERLQEPIEHLATLLVDPERCLFVPVVIPEHLSVSETDRLVDRLEAMHVRVSDILVNRLRPAVSGCPVCRGARCEEQAQVRLLRKQFPGHRLWAIPLQGAEVQGQESLRRFWRNVCPLEEPVEEPLAATPSPPRVERAAALPHPGVSLLLFAGKGGVGKTTLASATAFRLAQEYPDREVFLISTDPAHSLSDCLGMSVSSRGTGVGPRVTAMEIDAQVEFEVLRRQYADEVTGFFDRLLAGPRMVDLEFERDVLERILDLSPPGLDELMAVARVVALLESPGRRILVVDAAPTGHLIRLLEMPALVQDWLQVMFGLFLKYKDLFRLPKVTELLVGLSKKIHLLRALLASPEKGQLMAVSILTEMAFEETRDLFEFCRRAAVHVPALFLNQATPDSECGVCRSLFQAESAVRTRFENTFRNTHQCLVYRCGELRGADRLTELGRALYEA
jgi:arsenite-transporting ATPase